MKISTELLKISEITDVQRAMHLLKQGELVAIPTETVYGLAADAKNEAAIQKIFAAKERPANHPLILHIASFDRLAEWVEHIPDLAYQAAQKFWPGPLTILLPKKSQVSNLITGGLTTVAVRVPAQPVLRQIMTDLDTGLVAPSANPHTKLSPTSAQHVFNHLKGKIAAVLDGGACSVGIESTILDLTAAVPTILRQGPITSAILADVLGVPVQEPFQHAVPVAGNMLKHYQPATRIVLLAASDINAYIMALSNSNKQLGLMSYSLNISPSRSIHRVLMPASKLDYARTMYKTLHELDALKLDEIIIENPPLTSEWADIWDRLKRASHK